MRDGDDHDLVRPIVDTVDDAVREAVKAATAVGRIQWLPRVRVGEDAVDGSTKLFNELSTERRPHVLVIVEACSKSDSAGPRRSAVTVDPETAHG